jgi:hypothetical protein
MDTDRQDVPQDAQITDAEIEALMAALLRQFGPQR